MAKYISHDELLADIKKEVSASTQAEVAAKYGISRSMINEILSGRQGISKSFAETLGYKRELMFRKVA